MEKFLKKTSKDISSEDSMKANAEKLMFYSKISRIDDDVSATLMPHFVPNRFLETESLSGCLSAYLLSPFLNTSPRLLSLLYLELEGSQERPSWLL